MKRKKTKSQISEEKGDRAFSKKKFKKALAHYREAQRLDPDKTALYDKLVAAHKRGTKNWTREDFALSLEWTMKKQELENPELKKVHERLDPDQAKKALLETLLALKKSIKNPPPPPFSKGGSSDSPPFSKGGSSDSPPFSKGGSSDSPPLTKGGKGGFKK